MVVRSQYDVFVSYSHKDKDWARGKLIPKLEAHGFSVMADFRDFKTGGLGVEEMERGVLEGRRVLLVLTPSYVESRFGNFENAMAQTVDPDATWRKVIPVLREDCELPLRLRILHYRDLRKDDDEVQWELLVRNLI